MLLSFADGNGAVVTQLYEQSATALVIKFDGPLNPTQAADPGEYQVNGLTGANPEIVSRSGPSLQITGASYDASNDQVTLSLAHPMAPGVFYRVWINGSPGSGLTDATGTLFDGDFDDTPGGDFYALLAQGKNVCFPDANGDRAMLRVIGGGQVAVWRQLNGDVTQLQVVGAVPGQTTLGGYVVPRAGATARSWYRRSSA